MDFFELIKTHVRMCSLENAGGTCINCPLSSLNNRTGEGCQKFICNHTEEAIRIVEKWGEEHPIETHETAKEE